MTLPITPNWPYDLTEEQQKEWEAALHSEIEATCSRINALVQKRIRELLERSK